VFAFWVHVNNNLTASQTKLFQMTNDIEGTEHHFCTDG